MDLGWIVIAFFVGLMGLAISGMLGRWNRKKHDYRHNPLPGHRQGGADSDGGIGD